MPESAPASDITASKDVHASAMLHKLLKEAPTDTFTLDWLIGHLPHRSYGIILLFLALIALLPVISFPARILIIVLTFQIILGYHTPVLPRRWMERRLPSRHLAHLERRAIPALEHLEKIVRPRWPSLLKKVRPFAAFIGLLLTFLSLLAPLPLSNVPPSLICVLIALAYIEHDGVMLVFALAAAIVLLALVTVIGIQSFVS